MKVLPKRERHALYKSAKIAYKHEVIEFIKNPGYGVNGLCYFLTHCDYIREKGYIIEYTDLKTRLPEFNAMEPKKWTRDMGYWWPSYDHEARLEALDKMIEMSKPKKRSQL